MIGLDHYIRIYPGSLSPDECSKIIDMYQRTMPQHRTRRHGPFMSFEEVNLMTTARTAPYNTVAAYDMAAYILIPLLKEKLLDAVRRYKKDCELEPYQWPEVVKAEEFRIKQYDVTKGDEFRPHIDAVGRSAVRFLVCFWYLNDVAEGGETVFKDGPTVQPEAGKIIMFPSSFMYPHWANPPRSNNKFIVGTYLRSGDGGTEN